MIEVKNLVKSFDGFRALDGLNISVPKGAVYGLVGPNGAGKSTAIRHLAGIYRQDSGEVLTDGEPVYENTRIKEITAYIPDDIFYYTQATVSDMMRFYKSIYPRFSADRYERLGEALNIDASRPMRKLSKGMQKQVAFRLALSLCPEYVILDEPFDGLDPVMRRQVWNILLADVEQNETTILVSSHNLRELEDVCDHVGIMNKGKMLLEHSLSELQDNMAKIQLLPGEKELPKDLDIINETSAGRIKQLIIRGKPDRIAEKIAAADPVYMDTLPLSLEEIFIYELGGADREIKNIIL